MFYWMTPAVLLWTVWPAGGSVVEEVHPSCPDMDILLQQCVCVFVPFIIHPVFEAWTVRVSTWARKGPWATQRRDLWPGNVWHSYRKLAGSNVIGSSRKTRHGNELTHTQRRAIATSEINGKRDRSGVKGQDYFSCNKHISTLCNSEAGAGGRWCFNDHFL